MPFIKIQTNTAVTKEQETRIKTLLGRAIELIPGKSEEYLLLLIEPEKHIWLRGTNQPAAYIEAAVFANEDHAGCSAFSEVLTKIIENLLGIPARNIYIRYDDLENWAVNGQFIERRRIQ